MSSEIDDMMPIPAGALVIVTQGDFSAYSIKGVFRATREIDPKAVLEAYLKQHEDQRENYHFQEDAFLAWVFRSGALEPLNHIEWFLGGYSIASGMEVEQKDGIPPTE